MEKKKAQQKEGELWEVMYHGRRRKFTAAGLWTRAVEYFEWTINTPLKESQAFAYQGDVTLKDVPKMRPMTEGGLCLFIGLDHETWRRYKTGENCKGAFKEVATKIADIIYKQKFDGASAGLLNANIISRELGLADKKQVEANVNLKDYPIEFE